MTTSPTELIVILHGYGMVGANLKPLVDYWGPIRPQAVFLLPDAPHPCPGTPGRMWWPLTKGEKAEQISGVVTAAPAVSALIEEGCRVNGIAAGRVVIVGFSQGAVLALHLALLETPAVAGVVSYSGLLAQAPDQGRLQGHVPSVFVGTWRRG